MERVFCVVVYWDSASVYLERVQPEDIGMEQTLQMQTEKKTHEYIWVLSS